MKAFLVSLDNGEDYSDHSHMIACQCDTEAQAKLACKLFNDWAAKVRRVYNATGRAEDVKPCPIPISGQTEPFLLKSYTAEVLPVPKWAQKTPKAKSQQEVV